MSMMIRFGKYLRADNNFFTKNEEYLVVKYLEGCPLAFT